MKSRTAAPEFTPDPVEKAAAGWLVANDRGMTSRQVEEFQLWMRAEPRHAEVYSELAATWQMLPHIRRSAAAGTRGVARRRYRAWLPVALAAAAGLAVMVVWQEPQRAAVNFSQVAATEAGTLRRMELPDGSVLQLNASSAVAVRFTASERNVRLVRGEVHLVVAKNLVQPFIVTAGQVAVQAVGTAFGVHLGPNSVVDVLVTEGRVRVEDVERRHSLLAPSATPGEPPLLVAGQRARIDPAASPSASVAATVVAVNSAEIEEALAWHQRQLQFVSVQLAEIVAEFNRFNRHQLVIADPRLAVRQFGGTFLAGDYETFIRLLEASAGVKAERGENETFLRLVR
ncbi:MAG: FecR domain-containing protein [Opitutus sp.]